MECRDILYMNITNLQKKNYVCVSLSSNASFSPNNLFTNAMTRPIPIIAINVPMPTPRIRCDTVIERMQVSVTQVISTIFLDSPRSTPVRSETACTSPSPGFAISRISRLSAAPVPTRMTEISRTATLAPIVSAAGIHADSKLRSMVKKNSGTKPESWS